MGLPSLSSLPPNISTGPVYSEFKCSLITIESIESHLKSHRFQDSLTSFDDRSWLFISLLTLLLICVLKLSSQKQLASARWKVFEAIFQGFIWAIAKKRGLKLHLALILLWIVAIKSIYLSSIHTDMIVMEKSDEVDTFEDVIRRNLSVMRTRSDICFSTLKNSVQYSIKSRRAVHHIEKNPEYMGRYSEFFSGESNRTMLAEHQAAVPILRAFCTLPSSARSSKKAYTSKDPVINQPLVLFISQNLPSFRKKQSIKFSYDSLELGFYIYIATLTEAFARKARLGESDPDCLRPQTASASIEPISLTFFEDILNLFYAVSFIAIAIFIFEILFANFLKKLVEN